MTNHEDSINEQVVPHVIFEFPPTGGHRVKLTGHIPHAEIVNALEVLKMQMIHAQLAAMAQQAQQQIHKRVVLPDGPIR
jgi:hypothetical protein